MTVPVTVFDLVGWIRKAVRFIDAPRIEASVVPGAVRYRVTLSGANGQGGQVEGVAWPVDTATVWAGLPPGAVQLSLEALDAQGHAVAKLERNWHKAHPFRAGPDSALPVAETIHGVARHLVNYRHPRAFQPERPAVLWHATATADGEYLHEFTYPAWGHGLIIDFFMAYAAAFPGTADAVAGMQLAGELADALLAARSAPGSRLPNLFYSTACRGTYGGQMDGDTLMPTMSGHGARSLFLLGRAVSNVRWRRAAWEVAVSLMDAQNADGSWPFRVNPTTGEVVNPYTSNAVPVVLLWDELLASAPDAEMVPDTPATRARLGEARQRALDWVMSHPWRDLRWEGVYEDIPNLPAYENLEWFDASQTVQYVLTHPDTFPGERGRALEIVRWIEDQFIDWDAADVLNLGPDRVPIIPAALEQYRCYFPIDAHVARAVDLFLTVAAVTGDPAYAARSRALAGALVEARRPTGPICTWMWYDSAADQAAGRLTVRGLCDGDWFRCMAYDATVLLRQRQ